MAEHARRSERVHAAEPVRTTADGPARSRRPVVLAVVAVLVVIGLIVLLIALVGGGGGGGGAGDTGGFGY